jgi:hypothetical protein
MQGDRVEVARRVVTEQLASLDEIVKKWGGIAGSREFEMVSRWQDVTAKRLAEAISDQERHWFVRAWGSVRRRGATDETLRRFLDAAKNHLEVLLTELDRNPGSIIDLVALAKPKPSHLPGPTPSVANGAVPPSTPADPLPSGGGPRGHDRLHPGVEIENASLAWLWQNVPAKVWWMSGAALLGAFLLGVAVGNTTFVRELVGRSPDAGSAQQYDGPAELGLLAGDFVLDLGDPYHRSTLTKLPVTVRVLRGSVRPLREGELLKFGFEHRYFAAAALGQVSLASVSPSSALFAPDDQSSSSILVEFDSRALIPDGNFTAAFRVGDRQPFGHGLVRLFFLDHGKRLHEDVPFQLMFEKHTQ